MSTPQSGNQNTWPTQGSGQPPQQQPQALPTGQQPPIGQQPYGTYSAPYQPRPAGQDPQGGYQQSSWTPQPQQPFTPPSPPHNPGTPFLADEHRSVSIDDFKQPNSRRPLWLALLVLLAVGAILAAMFKFGGSSPSAPETPTPTPTARTSTTAGSAPTSVAATRSVPFTNTTDHSSGTFEILNYRWSGDVLTISVRVTLDQGSQRLGFFALDNTTTTSYDPDTVPDSLDGREVRSGETVTGTVQFTKPAGTTTIFFTDSGGRQVAALKVTG